MEFNPSLEKDKERLEYLIEKVIKYSNCKRKQVGCLLVKNNYAQDSGYNYFIEGYEELNENGETSDYVIHAEQSLIGRCARFGIQTLGATVYCTFSPCMNCTKLMITAKISRFVYLEDHSDQRGLELMRKLGIEVVKVTL